MNGGVTFISDNRRNDLSGNSGKSVEGCALLGALCLAAIALRAQVPAGPHQKQKIAGLIRVWGSGNLSTLAAAWEQGVRQRQPGMRFQTSLRGNASALGGLYTGAADIALMDREGLAIELDGYEQARDHKPLACRVATMNLANGAPGVFVYVDRAPGHALDRKVKEYLRFVLSQAGQESVARATGYLPLGPEILREERAKLE